MKRWLGTVLVFIILTALIALYAPVASAVVTKADTTVSITSSENPISLLQGLKGEKVTFTATVTAVAPATGTPTGTVTFYDRNRKLGSAKLDSAGKATFSINPLFLLFLGEHPITALYGGSAYFNRSTSAVLVQRVTLCPVPQQITVDLGIQFIAPNGTCIADDYGLTYYIEGEVLTDQSWIYDETYWGEYPLYLPGQLADIRVNATYTGTAEQVALKLVTEAYNMNTDGSNGNLINTQTHEFAAENNVTTQLDPSFTVPMASKGLYRFIAKVYSGDTLVKTVEAIFCPPPAEL